jgi:endonuclease/exonuclease/phosphatase (EEP) superfamily protein YafD
VDPTRLGRVARRFLLLVSPAGTDVRRITPALALVLLGWAALAAMVALTLLLWTRGDRWWPATVLLFGPRWLVVPPLALMALLAAALSRRALVPLVPALVLAIGPFLGFRIGWRALLPSGSDDRIVRVVTYNVQGGERVGPRIRELIAATRPDVVAIQECARPLQSTLGALDGWELRVPRRRALCLLSRFPIESDDTLSTWWLDDGYGGSGDLAKYVIQSPAGPLTLVNLHLETPRRGLASLRRGRGTARADINSQVREAGSERARAWLREVQGPLVVVGDFNMPVESRVYAENWGDLENAFSTAGIGFGWTRLMVRFQVRIDHVLATGGAHAVRAGLGPNLGSDHLPVVAAIRMP